MAVVLTDIQGLAASGVDARCGLWSEATPATKHRHAHVPAPMSFAYAIKPIGNDITGWPQEGSS